MLDKNKHIQKIPSLKVTASTFLAVACMLAFVKNADAATWQWLPVNNNDRERIVISLDSPNQNVSVERKGARELSININNDESLTQEGTDPSGNYFHALKKNNNTLELETKQSDFGFIYSKPNSRTLIIDLYKDPIATRFYPFEKIETSEAIALPTPAPTSTQKSEQTPAEPPTQTNPNSYTALNEELNTLVNTNSTQAPQTVENTNIPNTSAPIQQTTVQQDISANQNPLTNSTDTRENVVEPPMPRQSVQETNNSTPLQVKPILPASPVQSPEQRAQKAQEDLFQEVLTQESKNIQAENPLAELPGQNTEISKQVQENMQAVLNEEESLAQNNAKRRLEALQQMPSTISGVENPAQNLEQNTLQNPVQSANSENQNPAQNTLTSNNNEETNEQILPNDPRSDMRTKEEIEAEASKVKYGNSFTAKLTSAKPNSMESIAIPTYTFQGEQTKPNELSAPFNPSAKREDDEIFAPIDMKGLIDKNANLFAKEDSDTGTSSTSSATQAATDTEQAQADTSNTSSKQETGTDQEKIEDPNLELSSIVQDRKSNRTISLPPKYTEEELEALRAKNKEDLTLEEAKALNMNIVYQDAEGKILPPPPDPKEKLGLVQEFTKTLRYFEALAQAEDLKKMQLDPDPKIDEELREDLLYDYMNLLYRVNAFRPEEQGASLIQAANEALNYNPESPRIPEAYKILILTNSKMKNFEDANAYLNLLIQRYPDFPELTLLIKDLAQTMLDEGLYVNAEQLAQVVTEKYPTDKLAKDLALIQAKALYRQGHFKKALPVVDFITLRYPDAYVDDPEYLPMYADIKIVNGDLLDAVEALWTQYNLNPKNPDAVETLNKIALLYYTNNELEAATKVEQEILNTYPESEYAPKALLRIGENTLMPKNPSLQLLNELYNTEMPRIPSLYYQDIIDKYPNSPEAIDALTRLAAYNLYIKDYSQAMQQAKEVMEKYPNHLQYNVAKEVLLTAFAQNLENALIEQNYSRALLLWEQNPEIHDYYLPLEDDLRLALARGYLNTGQEEKGFELLEPFLNEEQHKNYGIYAYNLFLAKYLNDGDWNALLDLDEKVNSWQMPLDVRNQHDYTMALSAENLGLSSKALPLWQNIAPNQSYPLYQRAYATYFLARDAELKQDLRNAYQHNLDALAMFEQLAEERSEFADPQRVRESIAALMDVTEVAGRIAESLEWLGRYSPYVPVNSQDYAGLQLREARLYRKLGDDNSWRRILTEIVNREPESVFGKMAQSELNTDKLARDINSLL